MKKNRFLRLALCLAICAWVSGNLLMGTGTWAKYVATGKGAAGARFASFSFQVGSQKFDGVDDWYPINHSSYWEDIVTPTGIDPTQVVKEFSMPLFDYEYISDLYGPQCGGPGGNVVTVKSKDDALVVAPGMGHAFGSGNTNPGFGWSHTINFKNNSEVTLRFQLENITTSADILNLPICFDHGADNGYRQRMDRAYTFPGDLDASSNKTYWYVMQPVGNTGDTQSVTFWWCWFFDTHDPGCWGDLGIGAATNDAYETSLGMQAARAYKHREDTGCTGSCASPSHVDMPEVEFKFRITVEQVD